MKASQQFDARGVESQSKVIESDVLIKIMGMKRALKSYHIHFKPTDLVKSKSFCSHLLAEIEKLCPEHIFNECVNVVREIGNLDSVFDDFVYADEDLQKNPIIQDTLEEIERIKRRRRKS